MPASSSRIDFVVAGPMARTAGDLAIALDILAGPDELADGKGYKLSLPKLRHAELQKFRVLLLDTHPIYPTAAAVKKSINHLSENLVKAGVSVARTSSALPDLAEIVRIYATLLAAWCSVNAPIEAYRETEAVARGLAPNDNSLTACWIRGDIMSHREWLEMTRTRDRLRQQWRNLFKEFDVVLCPVMPTPAFAHDHSIDADTRRFEIDGIEFPYSHQYIWSSIATLFGLPATVVPIDQTKDGLPVGIQIIGDYLDDRTTLAFAKMLEQEFGGFLTPNLDK